MAMAQTGRLHSVYSTTLLVLMLLCVGVPVAVAGNVPSLDDQQRRQWELTQVKDVQAYFSRLLRISDDRLWGRKDYWATPAELLRAGGGDCEDMAAGKYFKLREIGVLADRLRLVYARVFDSRRQLIEAHMVLLYRYDAASEWQVLDNLTPRIEYLSQRTDLLPRLMFNELHVASWHASEGETRLGGPELIGRWLVLLQRQQALKNLASIPPDQTS
jgi:predicted transglutaminase-like cysteine proteinase